MKVEFFDSMEQAAARLRQVMEAADARVRSWQAALAPGDCFIADGGEEGLLVVGEVLEGYAEARLRHYRFCRCYSSACPEGELGDVHVSTVLCRISRESFEQMRAAGWVPEGPSAPVQPAAPGPSRAAFTGSALGASWQAVAIPCWCGRSWATRRSSRP